MFIAISIQIKGFDLSYYQGDVKQSVMECLKKNGHEFAIFQAQIGKTFNQHAISEYKRAKAAGIQTVDFYIFPTTSKDPKTQIRDTVNKLKQAGVINGNRVWLDIENHALFFKSCAENHKYVAAMLAEMEALLGPKGVGVYCNWVQWQEIMCGWTGATKYPVWYPHYDNKADFSDFKPFGGWTKPAIKQYSGNKGECGTTLDVNFHTK